MKKLMLCLLTTTTLMAAAQIEIPLYDVVPNSKPTNATEQIDSSAGGITRVSNVTNPTITVYTPTHANGAAIIICPGGGYSILAMSHEGTDVARQLTQWGITAFVLKYRLPHDKYMMDKSIAPLQDAQRAIQWVRQHAKKYNINTKKIGIMGFSAGGHLAASLSTRYNDLLIVNPKNIPLRPDFSVLIYPVISFTDSLTHSGSRTQLLGKNPSQYKINKYSCEMQVNKKTPPAFLVHAKDDKVVPAGNSAAYYSALLKNNIPATIKLYDAGGHGFGMHNKTTNDGWMEALKHWLVQQKIIK